MKKLLLITLIISGLFPIITKAQLSLIGKSPTVIKENMTHLDYSLYSDTILAKQSNQAVRTISYVPNGNDKDLRYTRTYFLLNDVCVGIMLEGNNSDLANLLGSMKDDYNRVDDSHWISKNAYYKCNLKVDKEAFLLYFEKI